MTCLNMPGEGSEHHSKHKYPFGMHLHCQISSYFVFKSPVQSCDLYASLPRAVFVQNEVVLSETEEGLWGWFDLPPKHTNSIICCNVIQILPPPTPV